MAIQLPNPGLGDGQTGDNEYVMWTKVKDNFSNQTHAASRLVGTDKDNVMQVGAFGVGRPTVLLRDEAKDMLATGVGNYVLSQGLLEDAEGGPLGPGFIMSLPWALGSTASIAKQLYFGAYSSEFKIRERPALSAPYAPWRTIYHTGNTTTDSNKNIKTSSPVVRVFSDHLDKIHEANDLPIEYTRNGVGDYTITGTTGLRENDWQIVIPKDDHDNQLIAFTIEDDNGTIRLKTYKRIFSMETFTFGPDLNTPMEIPEGRWVDLHFNDLPQEQLDESIE